MKQQEGREPLGASFEEQIDVSGVQFLIQTKAWSQRALWALLHVFRLTSN